MMSILSELLTGPLLAPPKDAAGWKAQWLDAEGPWPERALLGGLASDRPGWAFAWGYSAALRARLPDLRGVAALVVSEGRNTRPSTVRCASTQGRLQGDKSFVFLGSLADTLLVLAKTGEREGRAVLRVFPVASSAPGVHHGAPKTTPFVPEVPHGPVRLDLPSPTPLDGDGWSDLAKPFRLYEDLYVTLAMLGYGVRVCRAQGLPAQCVETLLPSVAALLNLASSLGHPHTPRALIPTLAQAQGALESLPWGELLEADAQRWRRDRVLFTMGSLGRKRALEQSRSAPG